MVEPRPYPVEWRELPVLLRGEVEPINAWMQECGKGRLVFYAGVICAGAGLYGAATGWWRAPLQACYTGIKLPLIILLTTLGNALLNGMLAPLLGLDLRFRQSLAAILMSFAIASAILGAFSPIVAFLVWNTPPRSTGGEDTLMAYSFLLLVLVGAIAFAGVAANLRLLQLLRRRSGQSAVAWRVLIAWLAGNLLLGSQLAWNLRPFIGAPGLPIQFIRPDAFQGNFFEAVLRSLRHVLS